MRLVDFLKYGNSVGKSFAVEIKVSRITDAQAAPLWNAIKNSRVQLQATSTRLPALNKIKKLDAADSKLKISYALITLGTNGWPSVSTIKRRHRGAREAHNPSRCCAGTGSPTSRCVCSLVETPPTTQK
jgi:hypothetical protein